MDGSTRRTLNHVATHVSRQNRVASAGFVPNPRSISCPTQPHTNAQADGMWRRCAVPAARSGRGGQRRLLVAAAYNANPTISNASCRIPSWAAPSPSLLRRSAAADHARAFTTSRMAALAAAGSGAAEVGFGRVCLYLYLGLLEIGKKVHPLAWTPPTYKDYVGIDPIPPHAHPTPNTTQPHIKTAPIPLTTLLAGVAPAPASSTNGSSSSLEAIRARLAQRRPGGKQWRQKLVVVDGACVGVGIGSILSHNSLGWRVRT